MIEKEITDNGITYVVKCPKCGVILGRADNPQVLEGVWRCACGDLIKAIYNE